MAKDPLLKELKWLSPKKRPFSINGFAWYDKEKIYRRLEKKPEWKISELVNGLADCTTGGQIRFKSNTKKLAIKVKLLRPFGSWHMTPTGMCGFDCYIGDPGDLHYISSAKFDEKLDSYISIIFEKNTNSLKNIVLNFPIGNGVKEVLIGIEKNAKVEKPPRYKSNKRIILYGTSITQGGCANRPGMAYPNILSRRFNYEFINLGFSGSAKGESEMARIVSEIKNPLCYVLDYEANSQERMFITFPEFIRILREKHPKVPIIAVSCIKFSGEKYRIDEIPCRDRKIMQIRTINECKKNGDKNIYFVDGYKLLGRHTEEGTVDGVHPTDLGFMSIADSLTPIFKKILHI